MRGVRLLAERAGLLQVRMAEMADRGGEHGGLLFGRDDVGDQLGGAFDDAGDQVVEIDLLVVLQVLLDELVDLAVQALGHWSPRWVAITWYQLGQPLPAFKPRPQGPLPQPYSPSGSVDTISMPK